MIENISNAAFPVGLLLIVICAALAAYEENR